MKPFQPDRNWFPIHNYVFDGCMPNLSNAGWRVLCVAIRNTLGWRDRTTDTGRKEWDQISYSQFRDSSGLRSDASISKGIQENLDKGYLIRRQVGTHQGTGRPLYAYCLNVDYEVNDSEPTTESVVEAADHKSSTSKTVVAATTESVAAATTESVETKHRKETNKDVDVVGLMIGFGIDPAVADRIAESRQSSDITGWIDYASSSNGNGLTDPVALVVRRLLDGVSPPNKRPARDGSRRFIEGEYADFIQH